MTHVVVVAKYLCRKQLQLISCFLFLPLSLSSFHLTLLSLSFISIPSRNNNNDTSRDNIFPFCVIWKPNKAIWNPQMAIQLYFAKDTQRPQKTFTFTCANTLGILCYRCSRHTRVDKKHTNGAVRAKIRSKNVYCHRNVKLKWNRVDSSRVESVTCHCLALFTYDFTLCSIHLNVHTMSHTCTLFTFKCHSLFYSFWPFHHDDKSG